MNRNKKSSSLKISRKNKKNKFSSKNNNPVNRELVDLILNHEREKINLEDTNDNEDRIREELLSEENQENFSNDQNNQNSVAIVSTEIVPVTCLQEHKLKKMLSVLQEERKMNESQNEFKKCLAHMHPPVKSIWTSPSCIMKAINECLLTRNWNSLTYFLIELTHFTGEIYKPLIRNVYYIMDQLHPHIHENGLQGEYKKIRKYHQIILNDTTVV